MKKAIVTIHVQEEDIIHSAWDTIHEAKHQVQVLRDHGYHCTWVVMDHNYPNGYYFI